MQHYWLTVGSLENYEISKSLGFSVHGIKSRQRKKALDIRPGDRMIYYLTGLMVLAGIVTVTSDVYEEETPIWTCSKGEVYPVRFKAEPYCIPKDASGFLAVKPFHEQLQYLKKWPEKNWTLGFQGNLHQWPEADYQLVARMFEAASVVV